MVKKIDPEFISKIKGISEQDMQKCFNCSKCTAICPMELNELPRSLFRYALLGMPEKIEEKKEEIFSCLLCGLCESTCPREVSIAENIRLMRTYLIEGRKECACGCR
jgi:heterodisulfide reductase subunit C